MAVIVPIRKLKPPPPAVRRPRPHEVKEALIIGTFAGLIVFSVVVGLLIHALIDLL